jgi:hypothetical protein
VHRGAGKCAFLRQAERQDKIGLLRRRSRPRATCPLR